MILSPSPELTHLLGTDFEHQLKLSLTDHYSLDFVSQGIHLN
ncbi:hypothetical protein SORDD15_01096 [Streptococcus oralis]|uniref:Uncharacterized protein n=1 Tax=Streptococcus oralis TaxID=1303 RepID=A0A139NXI7_STROR|nr:hypothetical protein SORDD15_01096 [Streptococcus oralis]